MADPLRRDLKHADLGVDVAVVGGGPGGLATAAALRAAFGDAIRVKVRQSASASVSAAHNARQAKACFTASADGSLKLLLAGVRGSDGLQDPGLCNWAGSQLSACFGCYKPNSSVKVIGQVSVYCKSAMHQCMR